MGFRFNENGIRKGIALILVGTIAGSVSYGQVAYAKSVSNESGYYNELLRGHYYDEDVKANREALFRSIEAGGSEKAKMYGKKKDNFSVPKGVVR